MQDKDSLPPVDVNGHTDELPRRSRALSQRTPPAVNNKPHTRLPIMWAFMTTHFGIRFRFYDSMALRPACHVHYAASFSTGSLQEMIRKFVVFYYCESVIHALHQSYPKDNSRVTADSEKLRSSLRL
jgi:hypothetical protein